MEAHMMTFAKWVKIMLKNPVIKDNKETNELLYTVGEYFDKNMGEIKQIHIKGNQIIISYNSSGEMISMGIPLNSNVLEYYYCKNSMKLS